MEENVVIEEKKEKDTKALVKKILVIVGNVVFYSLVILLFLFSLMNINAGNGTENFPNLFGKGMLSVESGSMERKTGGYHPAEWDNYSIGEIKTGDLIYDDVFGGDITSLHIGDVITFYDAKIEHLNTHRIVYIGDDFVITQGDYIVTQSTTNSYCYDITNTDKAKNEMLTSDHEFAQIVKVKDIKGVVTGVKAGGGAVLSNIRQNWLFYFVIPVAVILLFEIFLVVKNILDLRNEKNKAALADDKEAMMAELEAEKEKMRQELLAELKAQQASQDAKTDKIEDEAPVEEENKEESLTEDVTPVEEETQEEAEPEAEVEEENKEENEE